MNKEELISSALSLPPNAIGYYVSRNLSLLFPGKALVESEDSLFDIEEYAQNEQCRIKQKTDIYNQFSVSWEGPDEESPLQESRLLKSATNAWLEVEWNGHVLDVVHMEWVRGAHMEQSRFWILADFEDIANAFLEAVCAWNSEVRAELLVYTDGCWSKDRQLFRSIQNSTFANLILAGELKQILQQDLLSFFAARDLYKTYNIPWKRGLLLVGPPGNGKTHAVKALVNLLGKPCLYVKSFNAEYQTDERNIRNVFYKARKSAPCLLILEDLDTLLTPENRSFFLNEMDGFAANTGIVTLATTNHPERLDASILDRPSRFDRKYTFDLPSYAERVDYILQWNASVEETMRLSKEAMIHVAQQTEGFSFAYLKELYLSALMRWVASPQPDIMDKLLGEQIGILQQQMTSTKTLTTHKEAVQPEH